MKLIKRYVVFLLLGLSVPVSPAGAAGFGKAFSQGETNVSVVAGNGRSFNDDYIIFGVGLGYYVLNGLELGLDVQHWFSGEPSITKVSPQIKYVFNGPGNLKPYAGAFYRRTYIEDLDTDDSVGYRIGSYFSANNGVYIGGGIVYEEYLDCPDVFDCTTTYPEVLVSFRF